MRTCERIDTSGRGALEISTTAPPRRRNAANASRGGRKGLPAVVHHAPDVAQHRVVAVGDGAEAVDQRHARGGGKRRSCARGARRPRRSCQAAGAALDGSRPRRDKKALPQRQESARHDRRESAADDFLRRFPQGRRPRRHDRCGRAVPAGAQARLQADHRLRPGDRRQEILGADHPALPARDPGRPAGRGGGQFRAAADRAVHVGGADARLSRRATARWC